MERKWWTLIVVCVATFMLLLDITIVNVAMPSIQTALHSNFQDLQWVVDAYSLTLAALLLTAGSLADLLGRKLVFTVGLAIFTGASLVCGLSTTPLMLNLARGVQGIGGAAMLATSLALIAQEFQGRERGTAYGIWGATVSAAAAIGPMIGGLLTQGLGWESSSSSTCRSAWRRSSSRSRSCATPGTRTPRAWIGRGWSRSPAGCSCWCSR